MAKYEAYLKGDLNEIIREVTREVSSSLSSSLEEASDYKIGDTRVAIRAYERYSMAGQNRVSLTVTYVKCEDAIHATAIATGGSQAMFVKMNTFGEESFLKKVAKVLDKYRG